MSRIIATSAINGAYKIIKQAEDILAKAINQKGKSSSSQVHTGCREFLTINFLHTLSQPHCSPDNTH